MKTTHFLPIAIVFLSAFTSLAQEGFEKHPKPNSVMMQNWLMNEANQRFAARNDEYEQLKTVDQIQAYQRRLRKTFVERIGGFPERTPLNPQVTGKIQRDGYRVEKILFESQPQFFVSGALFVPEDERFQAPYPAVLVVCGHSSQAKAYEAYQTACALSAQNGIAAFIIDPIGQGERYQHLKADGSVELTSTTAGHSLLGLGSILLGQNTARFEIWDGMRAIDYLQTRDDIDPQRIGCMGNSGGGTQTAYLMALENRIKAASPACYITRFERLLNTIGPQDAEQNIYGQLDFGMDHPDYLMMRAPTPILICAASGDFFDIQGTWSSYREAKRMYSRMGYGERINLVETDNKHGWHQPLREAATQWMVRWLASRDEDVREGEIELIPEQELWASPKGQVLRMDGARSGFDLNREEYSRLNETRNALWKDPAKALSQVRTIAGIRELDDMPDPDVEIREPAKRQELEHHRVTELMFYPEPGIVLPARIYVPIKGEPESLTLFVHESGLQGTAETMTPESFVEPGSAVLAVDLRGTGQTKPKDAVWYDARFGEDGKHLMMAYLLGKSYVGMRAEDLLVCARFAKQQLGLKEDSAIKLVAVGEVGSAALHAAAVESDLFESVHIDRSLESWQSIVESEYSQDQLVHVVHGALRAYDLTDLTTHLGDKLTLTNPVDASGKTRSK